MKYFIKSHHDLEPSEQEEIYNLFQNFKNTFLEEGISFFDPSIKLFEDDSVFEDYEKRIIEGYDSSENNSLDKYSKQLNNASTKLRHFFANIVWLYNFPIRNESKLQETKIKEIILFLNLSDSYLIENKIASEGILNYGNLFHSKYADINFIYFFVKHYRQTKKNYNEIINNIDINTLTKKISSEYTTNKSTLPTQHILNYLFAPNLYEPIGSRDDKRKIVCHFMGSYDDSYLDEDLRYIRFENQMKNSESLFWFANDFKGKLKERVKRKKQRVLKKAFINSSKKCNKTFEFNSKNKDAKFSFEDSQSENDNKISTGLAAEELVWQYEVERVNKAQLVNILIKLDIYNNLDNINKNINDIMHYSKNLNWKAPFDIVSCRNNKILYIEVKSTTNDIIYFSKNEIIFAFRNYDNYEVRVVHSNEIYVLNFEKDILENIYSLIQNELLWSLEKISFKVNFL